MPKVYTKSELQEILDMYSSQDSRQKSIEIANNLLDSFINEKNDFEQSALPELQEIIETFCITKDQDGNNVLNELGARAMARYQSIIDSMENAENTADTQRIFSLTSDQNQIKFDLISLRVLRDMGLVPSDPDENNLTPNQIAEIVNSVNMTETQRQQYANNFISLVIGNNELFELVPPKILTDAYLFAREQYIQDKTNQEATNRFLILAKRIDYLIANFAKKVDYFYSDPSNIADIYAGYRKMCRIREKDIREKTTDNNATKKYKEQVKQNISETLNRLEEIVSLYSDMWNLKNLTPQDAEKLDKRWQEISDSLKDVEINNEILSTLSKYKFLDENGEAIPQFIDENGNLQSEFKPGYKLDPNGRLNRIISLAKTDVNMRNVGDLETEIKDINLESELSEAIPWKLAEISVPEQSVSGIVEHKPLTQEEVDEFWDSVKTDGGEITDEGYQVALDAQVNQMAGFAGMMAQRVGNDKTIVMRPFEAVNDIDKLSQTRTEKTGAAGRKKKINFFGRSLRNFLGATVVSAGLTFIGKATGVAYAGAAIGTTLGIGNMIAQGFKWRREQKKVGKPHGIKEFFSDKRNWAPALTSGLSVAAVISMATGNPELAATFGLSAMAVGGTSSGVITYKDAINAGYTRGQALAGALATSGSLVAGGLFGNWAMNSVINYVNEHTDSTLFKTQHTSTTQTETTQRIYKDGIIEHHEEMMLNNNWETQQSFDTKINGLMDAGLSHDDAVRYLLAWHDVTDHNLGNGYFNNIGLNSDALSALRGSINGSEINLTPESIAAFEQFNPHISGINTVGYIPGAPVSYDLPANATYDSNGVLIPGNDFYSTYVEHSGQVFSDIPIITNETTSIFTPNELAFPAGIGALGIYEPRVVPDEYLNRMRERAGALADRGERINQQDKQKNTEQDKPKPVIRNSGVVTENTTEDIQPDTPAVTTVVNQPKTNEETEEGIIEEKPAKRGFFGKCKDITYKIMQSVYHGVQKSIKGIHNINLQIQQGVNQMKLEDVKAKNKRAVERARGIKALNKEYKDMTVEDIADVSLKDAVAIAHLDEKAMGRIGKKIIELRAKFKMETMGQQHGIDKRLAELDLLEKEVEKFRTMGGKDAMDARIQLAELENKLRVLEAQGSANVAATIASGKTKVAGIEANGQKTKARRFGQAISAFFKGLGDTTAEDVTSADYAVKLAKKKLAKAKTDAAKKVWKKASERLAEIMEKHEYSEEQKTRLASAIIQETMNQVNNAK
ncbi:MAG: hypothetical protein IJV03_01805 [Alphaproteobacteria bacterium]|nr:hypothetical protein [Alphaproteobacteria bacterium]